MLVSFNIGPIYYDESIGLNTEGGIKMSETNNNKEIKKGVEAKVGSISFLDLLMDNEFNIKGNVISQKEKEYINRIVEQIYKMDWEHEDARIKMMFDLSLLIDEIKKIQTP